MKDSWILICMNIHPVRDLIHGAWCSYLFSDQKLLLCFNSLSVQQANREKSDRTDTKMCVKVIMIRHRDEME